MSAFKSGLPIIATSFVNKTGAIGLSLLPMILVEKSFSAADASLTMATVKSSILVGTLLGGYASDRFGVRLIFLASFFFQAFGLAMLPYSYNIAFIMLAGVIAQMGNSFFQATSRLLLKNLVPQNHQQEGIAWLRTGNNLGQVISYSLGAMLASLGTTALILFDSFTSFVAFFAGLRWIPKTSAISAENLRSGDLNVNENTWRLFILYGIFISGFTFLYELFMVGTAAKFRLLFGSEGLRIFSAAMVVNTLLCVLLSVPSSRFFRNPKKSLPLGFALMSLGAGLTFFDFQNIYSIYAGVFLFTFGEIIFGSLSQYVLLKIIPGKRGHGLVYSSATTMQGVARILAGTVAFPLVVYGNYSTWIYLLGIFPFLILFHVIRNELPAP
jgi:DHA1 family multidrug resistance protein-like MFS transporter